MGQIPASWDWYAATIYHRSGSQVVSTLGGQLPQVVRVERGKSSQPGYEWQERAVDRFDRAVFTVFGGGHNGHPHVRSTGEQARSVVPVLRSAFPDHAVSRCDSAIDIRGEGCFELMVGHGLDLARQRAVKWGVRGDWRDLPEREPSGRTFYLGSRQSTVFIRCYEKGLHELSSWVGGPEEVRPSPHWVRVEAELKPQKRDARLRAASLSQLAVWGCSLTSRDMLHRVCSLDVEKVVMHEHRESDTDRALRHMVHQYDATLRAKIDELGEVGLLETILQMLEESDRVPHAA